jgi:CBS domain-containing protein
LTIDQLVNDYILHTSRRCFPVVDDGHVWGLVTLHHVKEVAKEDWATATVGEVMTPFEQLKKVNPNDELLDVFQRMNSEDVNQLPVVEDQEDGEFLGMVARDNVMAFIHARSELGV